MWIQALTADPPNEQAKDRRNRSAKPGSQKLSLKVDRKGSKKSALPLISSSRLAWLMRRRLELGLETDPNVFLLIQGLSEHPELSALQILSWKKQNELSGDFLFIFTCGCARNTSKIDFLVTFEVFWLGCLPELELYGDRHLWGQSFRRSQLSYSHQNKWPAFQKRAHHWKGTQPGVP